MTTPQDIGVTARGFLIRQRSRTHRPTRLLNNRGLRTFGISSGACEVIYFLGLLALCPIVAAVEPGTPESAASNAESITQIERSIGVANEARIAEHLATSEALNMVVDAIYYVAHLSAVIGLLLWAWFRRGSSYSQVRNIFALTQLLVVAGYLLAPTTPPHLLGVPINDQGFVHHLQFAHAAFPSGHVAFAMVVAIGALLTKPPRVILASAVLYPVFVSWMVVATGNHYWLDVIAGALVAVSAASMVASRKRAARSRDVAVLLASRT